MHSLLMAVVLMGLATAVCLGQAATPATSRFAVSSVKPSAPDSQGASFELLPGGRVRATGQSVRSLVRVAWGAPDFRLNEFEVLGGPAWVDSERFDVSGVSNTGPINVTAEETLTMLQSLIRERFRLQLRQETRIGSILALTLDRKDRRPGGRMQPSQLTCPSPDARGGGGVSAQTDPACEIRPGLESSVLSLAVRGQPMAYWARYFTRILRWPVIDETELSGTFDVQLTFSVADASDRRTVQTSLDDALRDQLGLKLVARQGPATVFVIDGVERPTRD